MTIPSEGRERRSQRVHIDGLLKISKAIAVFSCLAAAQAFWVLASSPEDGQQPIQGIGNRPSPYSGPPVTKAERRTLRGEARLMFYHAFNSYMRNAFPKDDLRPLSCTGTNSQGGLSLTLIDALDTLVVLGDAATLKDAVAKLDAHLDFRIDHRVHVFELTIRALGALLSAHHMLMTNESILPGYDGSLLRFGVDLADRLLPAFDTPYGVPLSWINLKKGLIPGDLRVTCTACAGTLLLEFGALSRMTGQPVYESLARRAVEVVYGMRSTTTGLLGNTLDVDALTWVRVDGGIGAGIDSFYEYLLKAYLAFGDPGYLRMFVEVYAAAMQRLQLAGRWASTGWLADMHIGTGQLLHPWISSLSAFWPGLQVLAGQVGDAAKMHNSWMTAWTTFGGLPELFDISIAQLHPVQRSYPLRPELIESTYLLHSITGDPKYLQAGRALQETIADKTTRTCGFATISDLATGQLEDSMESFFLPETAKYLYLLNSDAAALPDYYIFSTEGHLLPPFPYPPIDSHSNVSSSPLLIPPPIQATEGGASESVSDQSGSCACSASSETTGVHGTGPASPSGNTGEIKGTCSVATDHAAEAGGSFTHCRMGDVVAQPPSAQPTCQEHAASAAARPAASSSSVGDGVPQTPSADVSLQAPTGSCSTAAPAAAPAGSQSLDQRINTMDQAMGRETIHAQQQRALAARQSAGFRALPGNVWNALSQVATHGLGMGMSGGTPSNCLPMCGERKEKDVRKEQRALRRAFPLLDFSPSKSEMLRARRCSACKAVTSVMQTMAQLSNVTVASPHPVTGKPGLLQLLQKMLPNKGPAGSIQQQQPPAGGDVSFASGEVLQQLLCRIQMDEEGGMACERLEDLGQLQIETSSLPDNSALLTVRSDGQQSNSMMMAPDAIQPDQTHIMLRLHHAEGREADPKDQDFPAVGASFGPSIAEYVGCVPGLYCGLQGKLRRASPIQGCQALPDNALDLQGAIAFLERGDCMFAEKVRNVAMAGAIGAVIVNNMEGGHLMAMGDDGQGNYPHIAAVLVDAAAGQQLSAATQAGDPWITLSDFSLKDAGKEPGNDAEQPDDALSQCGASASEDEVVPGTRHTKIDVMVPPRSQAWIAKQPGVVDLEAAMNSVLQAAASAVNPQSLTLLQIKAPGSKEDPSGSKDRTEL